jgi:hypothetical protein
VELWHSSAVRGAAVSVMIEGFSGDAGNDETKELPWHEEPGEFSSLDVDNGAWSDRRIWCWDDGGNRLTLLVVPNYRVIMA